MWPIFRMPVRFLTAEYRPRIYGWLYLACIPFFALLYTSIAQDFYHSTALHEKSLEIDLATIKTGIENSLHEHTNKISNNKNIIDHEWSVKDNFVYIDGITYDQTENEFRCRLAFTLTKENEKGPERFSSNLTQMMVELNYTPVPSPDKNVYIVQKRLILKPDEITDFDPYALIGKTEFKGINFNNAVLMPADLQYRMLAYARAAQGFPAHSSGTFGRMLYLSAVTITTLGYGDITPVSPLARFLVGLEAVLGIVIIGFYLTSLSKH